MEAYIGISGMGRIGRLVLRKMFDSEATAATVKAVNSTYPAATIAHLLKYDTVHGTWKADIQAEEDQLIINGHIIKMIYERDPAQIPWAAYGVKTVIDATGKFNNRDGAGLHLKGGAENVIISAPGKKMDLTVVMGVNDHLYDPEKHKLISAASCTTNCLSPVLKILDDAFKVRQGWMTTVHAYTNDQRHLDNPHKDLRRARACVNSIIPTSTGVREALVDVLPHLAPVVQGMSLRVPTPDVSLIDLTAEVAEPVTVERLKEAFRKASEGSFAPYVEFNEEPLVSSDYVGNDKSAIVDGLSLMAFGNQVKVLAWYDNEWGYACRVVDLAGMVHSKRQQRSEGEWCEVGV
ncbi:type I glyceraldehyde-3-phosphate dehydrogenase [Ferviditalea candida]|uniref:Glyceraldehyde-3-phosphate dehydrogenase n=1 Tax=Ferviditalea candida TaxID=3108399 RepID=A0ABU5ZJC6_9BACL|nr:type I glyceraldehyde-3-phosphate dehydrogenase [Paenibacillaceae bacterium T2]